MQKAFLFDMDGVLADTENAWVKQGYDAFLMEYFGKDLWDRVSFHSGMSIKSIFDAFVKVGWSGTYQGFHKLNLERGKAVYKTIPISEGVEDLIDYLDGQGYLLAVVSSSPEEWINDLTKRLRNHVKLRLTVSVNNHPNLKSKPAPDGYRYAMEQLEVAPENTFILEDSQTGVDAGKASGAKVICFAAHLEKDKQPTGADYYAVSMKEVQAVVDKCERP